MYFTDTPTLNSIEAIMKKLPYGIQKGGGRFRSPYKYTRKDCDCRFCLYYCLADIDRAEILVILVDFG